MACYSSHLSNTLLRPVVLYAIPLCPSAMQHHTTGISSLRYPVLWMSPPPDQRPQTPDLGYRDPGMVWTISETLKTSTPPHTSYARSSGSIVGPATVYTVARRYS
jgi:hypothetical protein